jgi:hypothetical protein
MISSECKTSCEHCDKEIRIADINYDSGSSFSVAFTQPVVIECPYCNGFFKLIDFKLSR